MKSAIIINPKSASGNTIRMWRDIQASLQRRVGGVEILMTEYAGHASQMARDLAQKDYDRLIVMGGDGSIHEVVNGLFDENDKAISNKLKIGILNSGRGCDFIKTLNIPTDPNDAISKLVDMHTKAIDVGCLKIKREDKIETHYYVNSCSYGLGGDVAKATQRSESFLSPTVNYFLASAIGFLKCQPFRLELTIEDKPPYKKECMNLFAMNGKCSGGGMTWAPHAKLDDGKIDLVIVEKMSKLKLATIAPKVYDGSFINVEGITCEQVKKVKIKARKKMSIEMDGEVVEGQELEISVLPQALEFIC